MGIWDVENWKKEITVEQLKRWLAVYRVMPFGDDWRRTARLAVTLAASNGAKVREDAEEMFLPTYDPGRPTQTEEEMLAELSKIPGFAEQLQRQREGT
jgi:hypothetical protein